MKKWSQNNKKEILRAHVFKYDTVESRSPDGKKEGVFDIVSCLNWVNVVAIDEKGRFVLVKQYRHGADEITLETPAGAIDRGEDPLNAAKRELEEECGMTSDDWEKLGEVKVNPAFMTNTCYFYLAQNCRYDGQQNFDPLEEIEIETFEESEIEKMIDDGTINHSLANLCLQKYFRLKKS